MSVMDMGWHDMWNGIPGSFAFRIANEDDKKRALKKLGILFFFSILPLMCVLLLTLFFPGGPAGNFFEYTQGGQIFFYVGSVMGSVTCLIAFEDVLDLHQDGDMQGEQRSKRETERLWLILYLVVSSLISLGALMTIQIKGETNTLAVNLVSYLLYGFSLYFWYVCILYESLKSNYFENEGSIKEHVVGDLDDFDGEG